MKICDTNKCTGCGLCTNICSQNCIVLKDDDKTGELHPVVNETTCILCKACQKLCPANNPSRLKYPLACYAGWNTDFSERLKSASGGAAFLLSKHVIQQGGIIFGTRLNNDLVPIIASCDTIDELHCYKGSRYVQSVASADIYKEMKKEVLSGRLVLFIGTPCQVSAALSFITDKYDNFITADLICHGVTPTKYYIQEMTKIINEKQLGNVSDIRFRSNDRFNFLTTLVRGNGKRSYHFNSGNDYYIAAFLSGLSLRENCFSCSYANPERIGDITIGDFIGLGKKIPFPYKEKNVSCITINTLKGKEIYDSLVDSFPEWKSIERDYKERLSYPTSMTHPFPKPTNRDNYIDLCNKIGFSATIRKLLFRELLVKKLKLILNSWTLSYKVPKMIVRNLKRRILKLKNETSLTKK